MLPGYTPSQIRLLISYQPLIICPCLCPITSCREESGRLTDGRHFKRFWLRGSGGKERLVVRLRAAPFVFT